MIYYLFDRLRNEENVPITCITFHLIKKNSIIFADKEGYIGSFESVLSTNKSAQDTGNSTNEDPLMEVSANHCSFAYITWKEWNG